MGIENNWFYLKITIAPNINKKTFKVLKTLKVSA
jgi:hypothetical protein